MTVRPENPLTRLTAIEPASAGRPAVSIILPAFNEENGIAEVIRRILSVMAVSGFERELIVVDDGSTDRTADVVRSFAGQVRLLQHGSNRGYGAALKTGLRHAAYDMVCITDADGTYPNERIPELVRTLIDGSYDMVVGARTGANVAVPLVRKPAKRLIGELANYVTGERIPDLNSGLRVFKRSVAETMLPLLPDGFSFTTTITLAMLTNSYLVKYVPIDYRKRVGNSKIRPVRDTLRFLQLIARMALYFAPLKIFVPLSFCTILLSILWGVLTASVFGRLADVSTMLLFMSGLQFGALGLLAELFHSRLPSNYRDERPDRR